MKKILFILLACFTMNPVWGTLNIKGLPYAYYGTDTGLGIGVFGLLSQHDSLLSNQLWSLYAEFNFTTRSEQIHKLIFKAPLSGLGGRPLELSTRFIYENIPFENYFGLGNSHIITNSLDYFYSFHRSTPTFSLSAEQVLYSFAGRTPYRLKTLISINLEYYSILASPELPLTGTGLLFLENPRGVTGGRVFYPLLGLSLDGRDNPYAPRRGSYHTLSLEWSSPTWGSEYSYLRFSTLHSVYLTLFPHLVLAERILWDILDGDVPFFKVFRYGGQDPQRAIGGRFSLKGIPYYLYTDNIKLINNLELRWMPLQFRLLGDIWRAGCTLFWDMGRVWQDIPAMRDFSGFHHTWGFGLRGHWGPDFVIAADLGFWQGNLSGVYIEVGEIF